MTRSIKAILSMLGQADKDFLRYSFEQEEHNKFVIYLPGRFIGVNIDPNLPAFKVEQTAGYYAEGSLTSGDGS